MKTLKAFLLLSLAVAVILSLQMSTYAQTNCPSGINIYVNSGEDMISIWSPLSNGDYHISKGWNSQGHFNQDYYSLDLNIAGTGDLGKAVYLPITGRVWSAYRPPTTTSTNYGYTVLIWDPGSGIVVRLAHLDSFSSIVQNTPSGSWLGAGTKAGYIGESGCPGCGTHLHMTAYRNVKVSGSATEQQIVNALSQGITPAIAQKQKFRLIAPSDNCDLIRFDDGPTIYTSNNGVLYPVTLDVWRSWGLSLNITPPQGYGTYDTTNGQIPIRVLPAYQRSWYSISSQLAWPRRDSAFRGTQYPDTYVFRWGQKYLLNANQFGDQSWHEYRWSEIQFMNQNFVDQIDPRTIR